MNLQKCKNTKRPIISTFYGNGLHHPICSDKGCSNAKNTSPQEMDTSFTLNGLCNCRVCHGYIEKDHHINTCRFEEFRKTHR